MNGTATTVNYTSACNTGSIGSPNYQTWSSQSTSQQQQSFQKLLYNFTSPASTIELSGAVEGSIVAPYSSVAFTSGSMDGGLYADKLYSTTLRTNNDFTSGGGGEVHNFLFSGTLQTTPEPGACALFAACSLSWGILWRRRRR